MVTVARAELYKPKEKGNRASVFVVGNWRLGRGVGQAVIEDRVNDAKLADGVRLILIFAKMAYGMHRPAPLHEQDENQQCK